MAAYGYITRKFIRYGEIITEHLAPLAITASKIANGAVLSAKVDENVMQYVTVDIPSAAILAMNSTPVMLVPGQAGKVISFAGATLMLDYGGTQYATNGTLNVIEETSGTVLSTTVANTLLFAAADRVSSCKPIVTDVVLTATGGRGIQLYVPGGNPATGNSVLRVKVAYRVHATGF